MLEFLITTVPLDVALIVPFLPPLQDTLVEVALSVTAAGSVIVTVTGVAEQVAALLPGFVAVSVYVPAGNPVAPTTVLLEFFMTTVPLDVALIVPLLPPLQDTLVEVALSVTAAGSVIVMVTGVAEQIAALLPGLVAVSVYVPAGNPVAPTTVLLEFFITTVPLDVALIVPLLPPLQETSVEVALSVTAAGSVIVTVTGVAEQVAALLPGLVEVNV